MGGISQFTDAVNWSISGVLPMSIDFNTFCGRPPVTVCLYTLKSGLEKEGDTRHLESRKNYYFRLEFWSSKKPPTRQDIAKLFPDQEDMPQTAASSTTRQRRSFLAPFACCAAQGRHTD